MQTLKMLVILTSLISLNVLAGEQVKLGILGDVEAEGFLIQP